MTPVNKTRKVIKSSMARSSMVKQKLLLSFPNSSVKAPLMHFLNDRKSFYLVQRTVVFPTHANWKQTFR